VAADAPDHFAGRTILKDAKDANEFEECQAVGVAILKSAAAGFFLKSRPLADLLPWRTGLGPPKARLESAMQLVGILCALGVWHSFPAWFRLAMWTASSTLPRA
jgi:hypothetical protein